MRGLRRPGAVAADIEGRLVVSDTGNHRILVGHAVGSALDVLRVVGSGEPGLRDGRFEEACFDGPRGIALSGDMLIVADAGNHVVRMVDLSSNNVATMVGTGDRAGGVVVGEEPLGSALDHPWDVLLHEYDLYIAMGGTGEVWRLDMKEGSLAPFVKADRSRVGEPAPMGLATDDTWLYVADASSSRLRRVRFEDGGGPEVLIEGRGGERAGIAWGQGNHRLWMSDAAKTVLEMVDPDAGRLEPVVPFEAELDHPEGLASAGHLVYVADAGNDRVLRVDQIDKRVVGLALEGP